MAKATIKSKTGAVITIEGSEHEVSNIPLPGALPLFASGLGAMGFIGWRRKRKAIAA